MQTKIPTVTSSLCTQGVVKDAEQSSSPLLCNPHQHQPNHCYYYYCYYCYYYCYSQSQHQFLNKTRVIIAGYNLGTTTWCWCYFWPDNKGQGQLQHRSWSHRHQPAGMGAGRRHPGANSRNEEQKSPSYHTLGSGSLQDQCKQICVLPHNNLRQIQNLWVCF